MSLYEGFFGGDESINVRDYKVNIWRSLPETEQLQWIDEVFYYYRNVHGFPYYDLSKERIHKELWKLRKKPITWLDNTIQWDNTATTLCAHYFPHLWTVPFRNKKTAWEAFHNDKYLKDAIRLCFQIKPSVAPSDLIGAFCLGTSASVGVVSRFKPIAAKAVWDRYTPEYGICYDYACGWGGRMMGAAASTKQLTYYGVDPEPKTFTSLENLSNVVSETYREDSRVHLYKIGSEDFCPDILQNRVDVAFSSPPYFDLEKYSDNPDQSHIKFPTVDTWLDGFLLKTFSNIFKMLKPGGILAINLIDFDKIKIVNGAQERILSLGFLPIEELSVQMAQRRGNGQDTGNHFKTEPIYVYQKN